MPTFTQTARFALRWLTGANTVSDVDAGFQALAEDVDANMAGWLHGPLGSRPTSTPVSPGKAGRIYFADDTGQAFLDTGSSWLEFTLGGAPVSVPTATVLAFGGSAAPAGYLLCDGAAKDRTAYADLFAAIGTAHGAGNGSTTFNIPDLRGRVPVGAGQGTGLTNRVLGAKIGEEAHALSVAEMPAHSHGGFTNWANQNISAHNHAGVTGAENSSLAHGHNMGSPPIAVPGRNSGSSWGSVQPSLAATAINIPETTGSIFDVFTTANGGPAAHTHSFVTGVVGAVNINEHDHNIPSQGGGAGHNVVQPSQVVNYVIKT